MYLSLIPLLLGFVFAGASAFTSVYSRWWGEHATKWAASILRNFLGIPLWLISFIMAWLQPARVFFNPDTTTKTLSWLAIFGGSALVSWGHLLLGWRAHLPSAEDSIVRHGLYSRIRHPIYAGIFLILIGFTLLNPTLPVAVASALGVIFFIVIAHLEEIELMQRLPEYREYMKEVPRLVPRIRRSRADMDRKARRPSALHAKRNQRK